MQRVSRRVLPVLGALAVIAMTAQPSRAVASDHAVAQPPAGLSQDAQPADDPAALSTSEAAPQTQSDPAAQPVPAAPEPSPAPSASTGTQHAFAGVVQGAEQTTGQTVSTVRQTVDHTTRTVQQTTQQAIDAADRASVPAATSSGGSAGQKRPDATSLPAPALEEPGASTAQQGSTNSSHAEVQPRTTTEPRSTGPSAQRLLAEVARATQGATGQTRGIVQRTADHATSAVQRTAAPADDGAVASTPTPAKVLSDAAVTAGVFAHGTRSIQRFRPARSQTRRTGEGPTGGPSQCLIELRDS